MFGLTNDVTVTSALPLNRKVCSNMSFLGTLHLLQILTKKIGKEIAEPIFYSWFFNVDLSRPLFWFYFSWYIVFIDKFCKGK